MKKITSIGVGRQTRWHLFAYSEMDDVKPAEERGPWERGLGNAFPEMDDVKPTEFFFSLGNAFPEMDDVNQLNFLWFGKCVSRNG